MRYLVESDLCTGHGRCYSLAPEVYDADDDGFNADRGAVIEVQQDSEANAVLGAKSCPERAIMLRD